jgi:hypothetical protein
METFVKNHAIVHTQNVIMIIMENAVISVIKIGKEIIVKLASV